MRSDGIVKLENFARDLHTSYDRVEHIQLLKFYIELFKVYFKYILVIRMKVSKCILHRFMSFSFFQGKKGGSTQIKVAT